MKILKTLCLFLVASSLSFAQIQFHSPTGGQVVLNGPGGATTGVASINTFTGAFSFTGGVTCTGGTPNVCNFTGATAGVTSIDSQTGAFTFSGSAVSHVGNAYVFTAGGGGGGGGGFPSTTAMVVISFSGLYDDANSQASRSLGVPTSVNCVHTSTSTCTVVFSGAHSLATNNAVDMSNLSAWPASPAGATQQAAQYGSFQVTTVPNGTTITFTTPTTLTYSCGPCTGTVWDASNWGIWQFAIQPLVAGHGTIYGIETTTQSAATGLSTWVAGISGTPRLLIDQTGQNDLLGGRSVSQLEADKLTVWAAAHTASMLVMEQSIVPAQYGLTGVNFKPGQVNYWLWQHSRGITATQRANGQYMDMWVDVARALLHSDDQTPTMPDPTANQVWAQVTNNAFATQSGIPIQPADTFSYSASGLGADVQSVYQPTNRFWYDSNWNAFKVESGNAGGWLGMDLFSLSFTGGPPTLIREWNAIQSGGTDWFGDCLGRDTTTNDGVCRGFHYAGSGSTSNYMMFRPYGGSTDIFRHFNDGSNESLGQQIFDTTTKSTLLYSAAGTAVPTCNGGSKGTALVVSDATAPTYLGTYTSGGAVVSPALCNGTNWVTY